MKQQNSKNQMKGILRKKGLQLSVGLELMACGMLGLSLTTGAHAQGGRAGNGGDALICKDPKTGAVTARLLDTWEAEIKRMELSVPGDTLGEKTRNLLDRLAKLDPTRASHYSKIGLPLVSELEQEGLQTSRLDQIHWVDSEMRDLPDSLEIYVPENCRIVQLIVQIPEERRLRSSDPKFYFYRTAWKMLTASDQAAALLHEIIYMEAFGIGHSDSVRVRSFNRILLEIGFEKTSIDDYIKIMKKMNFSFNDPRPVPPARPRKPKFEINGNKVTVGVYWNKAFAGDLINFPQAHYWTKNIKCELKDGLYIANIDLYDTVKAFQTKFAVPKIKKFNFEIDKICDGKKLDHMIVNSWYVF